MIVGDVRDALATIPDGTVDLVLTSPPFLGLRSYLPADHPSKGREIGSEANPAAFVDVLLELTAEWRRVLAPHGSLAVELGDTYAGRTAPEPRHRDRRRRAPNTSHRARPDGSIKTTADRRRSEPKNQPTMLPANSGPGWPLAKSLCLVPELYRVALAYGIHPLTGAPSPAGAWRVRNVVRWVRPNPPVGALADKYRHATSEIVVACTSRDRWFDLDAVRHAPAKGEAGAETNNKGGYRGVTEGGERTTALVSHPAGAPLLDWWEIPTHGYRGAHYATWPPALCTTPIASMCPRKVCTVCGEPSRRIVPRGYVDAATGEPVYDHDAADERGRQSRNGGHQRVVAVSETVGWTDCGHDSWRPGVVLDPFSGSGTTLAVATGMGRDAIGIDLDERNVALAAERIGMLLTDVQHLDRVEAAG